jgi:hypothetical protein
VSIGSKVRFVNPVKEYLIVGIIVAIDRDYVFVQQEPAGPTHQLLIRLLELFDFEVLDDSQTSFPA